MGSDCIIATVSHVVLLLFVVSVSLGSASTFWPEFVLRSTSFVCWSGQSLVSWIQRWRRWWYEFGSTATLDECWSSTRTTDSHATSATCPPPIDATPPSSTRHGSVGWFVASWADHATTVHFTRSADEPPDEWPTAASAAVRSVGSSATSTTATDRAPTDDGAAAAATTTTTTTVVRPLVAKSC
jgi:hypothetical protein